MNKRKATEPQILEDASIQQLQIELEKIEKQKSELEERLKAAEKKKREAAVAEIVKTIKDAGLTVYDIAEAFGIHIPSAGTAATKKVSTSIQKYRNPETGETHSGRGGINLPSWLKEAKAAGNEKDFEIPKADLPKYNPRMQKLR